MSTDTRDQDRTATAPRAANGLPALVPAPRAPSRVEPLAVLPLFARMTGRSVLLVGGGEGAAWKAELLAAAGADVRVLTGDPRIDEAPSDEMAELAARSRDGALPAGSVLMERRGWRPGDLFGTGGFGGSGGRPFLALIDTPCHAEAASFAALAREAGVIVNCIDKPEHCDVQFGSIVNRSPVVVGISTDGAAPILGQTIRRRIETLLPPSVSGWAAAMARGRARVLRLLPERAHRRAFFERFADLAMRGAPAGDGEGAIDAIAHGVLREGAQRSDGGASKGGVGHVTLVGAGPGDAELLTIRAVRALQSADVILFDALVSEDVLELARREARRMLVGKRASKESCRQEDINALMLKLAGEGRRVVRLKSGDPMVFGRAGEEIEALTGAGVPFDVVPGITSAFALAAQLGISLTHRDHARSLRFVTGHGANGQLPDDLDWQGLADPSTTLVVYMGARTAPLLAERLIERGTPHGTPTLAAAAVGRPEAQTWRGTLGELAAGVRTLDGDQPIIIAIGDALRQGGIPIVLEGTLPDHEGVPLMHGNALQDEVAQKRERAPASA